LHGETYYFGICSNPKHNVVDSANEEQHARGRGLGH
jgi:hypothetical protein